MTQSIQQKPLPPWREGTFKNGRSFIEATSGQRVGKYALDVLVILVLFVILFFVLAVITAAAGLSREAGAGVAAVGGYALSALGYGFVSGFSRTLGAKAAGVRNLRYRDGKPMGPLQSSWRTLALALFWPLILIGVVVSPLTGSPGINANKTRFRSYVVADVRGR
ncbi:hypothetical protein GC088_00415 [Arthrobacter sp. JZ12]|uniref:RDD family protein n=1 Tax=Arthrobacter sp. JZ12 TaxID=2654190 RepID=UPI002B4699AE|nr:RDD family protein [Arthrobacter sp. JZ12]WRH23739.1 hypothetical protein GC088_00415 [Arthrobacter sp. JZ12]